MVKTSQVNGKTTRRRIRHQPFGVEQDNRHGSNEKETTLAVKYVLDNRKKEATVSTLCPHTLTEKDDEEDGLAEPPNGSLPIKENQLTNGMRLWVKWALDGCFYRADLVSFKRSERKEEPVIAIVHSKSKVKEKTSKKENKVTVKKVQQKRKDSLETEHLSEKERKDEERDLKKRKLAEKKDKQDSLLEQKLNDVTNLLNVNKSPFGEEAGFPFQNSSLQSQPTSTPLRIPPVPSSHQFTYQNPSTEAPINHQRSQYHQSNYHMNSSQNQNSTGSAFHPYTPFHGQQHPFSPGAQQYFHPQQQYPQQQLYPSMPQQYPAQQQFPQQQHQHFQRSHVEVNKSPFAAAMESSMFVADATNNRPDGQEVLEDIEAIMPEKSPMSGVLIEDEDDNHDNDTISQKNEGICQQCKKYSQRIRDLEKQLEIAKENTPDQEQSPDEPKEAKVNLVPHMPGVMCDASTFTTAKTKKTKGRALTYLMHRLFKHDTLISSSINGTEKFPDRLNVAKIKAIKSFVCIYYRDQDPTDAWLHTAISNCCGQARNKQKAEKSSKVHPEEDAE